MEPVFTADVPCPSCGYNLRGLSLAHGCPECGLRVVSYGDGVPPGEAAAGARADAEVERNLGAAADEQARLRRLDALLSAWECRGQRLDELMDRLDRRRGGAS